LASPRAAGAATVTRTSSAFTPDTAKKQYKFNPQDSSGILSRNYMTFHSKCTASIALYRASYNSMVECG